MRGNFRDWLLFCVCLVQHTRTAELVEAEIELLQVREIADRRRDGACARAREFCVDVIQQTYRGESSTSSRAP